MPIEKIVTEENRSWGLWKITESEETLNRLLRHSERAPENVSNKQKRLEWVTGRILTQCLLDELGLPYYGVTKNGFGKPSPAGHALFLSLSHSYPYVAAIVDRENEVGIDLEQPKEKLLRVGPRVLSVNELGDAGTDLLKHCVYWCAKEALIKVHGRKDLVLSQNLHIEPFSMGEEGQILGKIIVLQQQRVIPLYYRLLNGFMLVYTLPDKAPGP